VTPNEEQMVGHEVVRWDAGTGRVKGLLTAACMNCGSDLAFNQGKEKLYQFDGKVWKPVTLCAFAKPVTA
jgi:hypothetical protein